MFFKVGQSRKITRNCTKDTTDVVLNLEHNLLQSPSVDEVSLRSISTCLQALS